MPLSAEQIACICHEANRGLQRAQATPGIPVALPWDGFRVSYPDQADGVVEGVRLAIEGATPEQLHESWCARKREDGWVYGPTKDAVKKIHPCLLEYDQLPVEQRVKDRLFSAIVHELVA